MSRVVIISNRVMLPEEKKPEAAGGLAVALFDTLQETNGLWFGWSGAVTTDKIRILNHLLKRMKELLMPLLIYQKKIMKITTTVIVTKYFGPFFTIDWT